MSRRQVLFAAGAVTALALALRLLGLRLGLPYVHHWDECWVAWSAKSMLEHGNDVPTSYQYGAPLSRLTVLGFHAANLVLHTKLRPDDEIALRWIARLFTVAISSSGALGVFVAARSAPANRPGSDRPAVFAALLYAVSAELVLNGRYGVTDACVIAWTTWALAFASLYLRTGALAWGAGSVAATGLAFAFKLPGVFACAIPALALLLGAPAASTPRRALAHRALLVAAVPAVFVCWAALNPHVLDRWDEALRDITVRAKQTHDGGFPFYMRRKPGLEHLGAALWAIVALGLYPIKAVSLALSGVAVFGLGVALKHKSRLHAVALVHAAVVVLAMALPNKAFVVRNYLVAVPVLCLGFGVGVDLLLSLLEKRASLGARASLAAAAAVVLVVAAVPLRDAVENQRQSVDTRMRALDWIAAHVAGGSASVAITPTLVGAPGIGIPPNPRAELRRTAVRFLPDVKTAEDAQRSGADYVVTASYRGDDWVIDPYPDRFLFERCDGYEVVAEFTPNPHEHNFEVTPSWDGRVTTKVLAKKR